MPIENTNSARLPRLATAIAQMEIGELTDPQNAAGRVGVGQEAAGFGDGVDLSDVPGLPTRDLGTQYSERIAGQPKSTNRIGSDEATTNALAILGSDSPLAQLDGASAGDLMRELAERRGFAQLRAASGVPNGAEPDARVSADAARFLEHATETSCSPADLASHYLSLSPEARLIAHERLMHEHPEAAARFAADLAVLAANDTPLAGGAFSYDAHEKFWRTTSQVVEGEERFVEDKIGCKHAVRTASAYDYDAFFSHCALLEGQGSEDAKKLALRVLKDNNDSIGTLTAPLEASLRGGVGDPEVLRVHARYQPEKFMRLMTQAYQTDRALYDQYIDEVRSGGCWYDGVKQLYADAPPYLKADLAVSVVEHQPNQLAYLLSDPDVYRCLIVEDRGNVAHALLVELIEQDPKAAQRVIGQLVAAYTEEYVALQKADNGAAAEQAALHLGKLIGDVEKSARETLLKSDGSDKYVEFLSAILELAAQAIPGAGKAGTYLSDSSSDFFKKVAEKVINLGRDFAVDSRREEWSQDRIESEFTAAYGKIVREVYNVAHHPESEVLYGPKGDPAYNAYLVEAEAFFEKVLAGYSHAREGALR